MCRQAATLCEQAQLEQEATQDCALRYLEAELARMTCLEKWRRFLALVVPQLTALELARSWEPSSKRP